MSIHIEALQLELYSLEGLPRAAVPGAMDGEPLPAGRVPAAAAVVRAA